MKKCFFRTFLCLIGPALLLLPACAPDDDPPVDPIIEATLRWEESAHADAGSPAATFWDGAMPPAIPVNCAGCHSTRGFIDFLGADGSAPGVVDEAVPVGQGDNTISCRACHDDDGLLLPIVSATFPSGATIDGLGSEAACMQCHQGRKSGADVDRAITAAGVGDDEVSESLTFINIHYGAAAATLYGSEVGGGYEYAGQRYPGKVRHRQAAGVSTCTGCHDPHSTKVDEAGCLGCHRAGFDAVKTELADLQEQLYAGLQAYASETAGAELLYAEDSYPYFFAGAAGGEPYRAWTPRLLRAAYNYHLSVKDTGAYTHNSSYIRKLLGDSIKDLRGTLGQ